MADYINIILTDGTNKTPMKVPKKTVLNNSKNGIFYAKEGSEIKLSAEQYKAAIALSKLDNQSGDLDEGDFEKFAKMSKTEQTAFINKALGNDSKNKVGKNYSAITDDSVGIIARKNFIAIPFTEGGREEEDPKNIFRMEI